MPESLTPDLDGTMCVVTTCFDVADVLGKLTGRIPALVGVPDEQALIDLRVPLCIEHGHLLRMGLDRMQMDGLPDD